MSAPVKVEARVVAFDSGCQVRVELDRDYNAVRPIHLCIDTETEIPLTDIEADRIITALTEGRAHLVRLRTPDARD